MTPEALEHKAKVLVASAIDCATEEFPEDLRKALALPMEAWPSAALGNCAAWVSRCIREGKPPTHTRLGVDLPSTAVEITPILGAHALPFSTAVMEAREFFQHYQGTKTAAEFDDLARRIREKPERAAAFIEVAIPQLQGIASNLNPKPRLSFLTPEEILAIPQDPAENILGDRLLTKRGQLVIAGAGGVGKSRIALQLAASSILGIPFITLPTFSRGLRWMILQAENDTRRQQSDLVGLRDFCGERWGEVQDRLILHALVSETDGFLNLDHPDARAGIRQALDLHRPDVVVVDSLYNVAVGDLNKDADMRETLTLLASVLRHRNPSRALVVIHHARTGKNALQGMLGHDRASFSRNSKVLHSWARGMVNVAPLSGDRNDLLAFVCGKASNGREFAPFAAELEASTMTYRHRPDVGVHEEIEAATESGPTRKQAKVTAEQVAAIADGHTRTSLAREIQSQFGAGKSRSFEVIKQAEASGLVKESPSGRFKTYDQLS